MLRDGQLYRVDTPEADVIESGDILLCLRKGIPPKPADLPPDQLALH